MTRRKEHHVVPHEGKWGVKKAGSKKFTKLFDRFDDAVEFGKTVSTNQGSELVIHEKNGNIRRVRE